LPDAVGIKAKSLGFQLWASCRGAFSLEGGRAGVSKAPTFEPRNGNEEDRLNV